MTDNPEGSLTVWKCPECGEQIHDSPEQQPDGTYKRGHYHERPPDWPHAEDPYFLAEPIPCLPLSEIESLVSAARELLAVIAYDEQSPCGFLVSETERIKLENALSSLPRPNPEKGGE